VKVNSDKIKDVIGNLNAMKIDRSKSNVSEWNMRKTEIGFKRCLNEVHHQVLTKAMKSPKKKTLTISNTANSLVLLQQTW
jgi:ribosomal protein L22